MTDPIRISAIDKTDEEVRARHEDIEKRLSEMGLAKLRLLMENGGLPTEWNPIIFAWLSNDKLEKAKKRGDD
jgi:hypothetical protein